MRLSSFCLLGLMLVGCSNPGQTATTSAVVPLSQPHPLDIQAAKAFVSPKCNDLVSVPSMHNATVQNVQVQQHCGLVAEDVSTDAFRAQFATSNCQMPESPECNAAFVKMFVARMGLRYTAANWAQIRQTCDAYPDHCRADRKLEIVVLESHNRGVLAWYRTQAAELARRQQQVMERQYAMEEQRLLERQHEKRAQSARKRQAWKAFGDSFKRPATVNCTSTTYGSTTNTSCR